MSQVARTTEERSLVMLLSQALIAFSIELDNEFEHRMAKADGRRFRVSVTAWSNFLRHLDEGGMRVRDFTALAGFPLSGMERWGYVEILPDAADPRPNPPRAEWTIRPTAAGRRAQEAWPPLFPLIEARWEARFGREAIEDLRAAFRELAGRLESELPHYPPVVGPSNRMFDAITPRLARPRTAGNEVDPALSLAALLSQALLAFALEFERESRFSLPAGANVVRVLGEDAVRVRDLPALSGVSKEGISMVLGFLRRDGHVLVEPDAESGRGQVARLAPKGRAAREADGRLLRSVEERWATRFGDERVQRLRSALERLFEPREQPRLSEGLRPYPEGWRAQRPYLTQTEAVLRDPAGRLPHYPMVLHRGGWPDGS